MKIRQLKHYHLNHLRKWYWKWRIIQSEVISFEMNSHIVQETCNLGKL